MAQSQPKPVQAAASPSINQHFASLDPNQNMTIQAAKKLVTKLGNLGISIDRSYTIPKMQATQANDISLEDAVEQYNVDPELDLIDIYIHAQGAPSFQSNSAALIAKMVKEAEQHGIGRYQALYQSFYPGADWTAALLNLPNVNAAIKKAIQDA